MALLRRKPLGPDLSVVDTWPKVLEYNSTRFGAGGEAMRYKHYGIWQTYSWREYLENVKYLSLGLRSLGFEPGDKLLVVGDNSPEWYFGELAAQCARGVSVGLYSDLSAAEIEYVARDCGARFAMVQDQEQADKIVQIRDRLPDLEKVVYWRYKGLSAHDNDVFIGLQDVMERGRSHESEHAGAFEEGVAAGQARDICAIVYTSGTTGDEPKGALHSHGSLMAGAELYRDLDRLGPKDDIACYLPPAWIFEQLVGVGCHLLSGGRVNFFENAETQQEDFREIAPTVVLYSSRLWENLAGQVRARTKGASFLKRWTVRLFMPVGLKITDPHYAHRRPAPHWWLLGILADVVVFRPVRDSLGLTRARVCYSTGSTLCGSTMRFFHALKVPLKTSYGSAEAGAVTGAVDRMQTPGTVGSINRGVEVKLTDAGEILVRHPGVFLGYNNDPQRTAQVLRDGWVHTGDKGHMEAGQELVFVDRADEMICLPCGDLLAPQDIESRLKDSPYIKDAWVMAAQDCEGVSAVIIIDAGNTGTWADKRKVAYTTFGDLSQKPEVYRLIEQEIFLLNEELAEDRRIGKFVNLHKEFDSDESELTRNRKLRRTFLTERYADLVKAFAEGNESIDVEAQFTYQDGRTGMIRTALQITTIGRGDQ